MLNTGDKITTANASLLKPGDWVRNSNLAEEGPFIRLVEHGMEWRHPRDRPRGDWQPKLSPLNLMTVVALAREDDPGGLGLADFKLRERYPVVGMGPYIQSLEKLVADDSGAAAKAEEDERTISDRLAAYGIFSDRGKNDGRRYLRHEGEVVGLADAKEAAALLGILDNVAGRAAGALLAAALGQDDRDAPIIWAMAKAHDREESAQKGEPSPWREDFDRDPDWEQERFLAMREAFDVAKPLIVAEPNDLLSGLVRLVDMATRPGGGSIVPQKVRDYLDGKRPGAEEVVEF